MARDRRNRYLRLLSPGGCSLDRQTDFVKDVKYPENGVSYHLRKRFGEGAIAVRPIERNVSGLCRERDQCALSRLHLCQAATCRAKTAASKRIVSARIQNDQV